MTATPLPLKLGLIPLALYLLLAAGAALVVPSDYGADPRPTPPDEGPHVGYVAHLATAWSLPVFRSLDDNYEGHQPPLYYATALPAYFVARTLAPGETGGLSRTGLVLLRLWSVLVGGIAVWALWLLGRLVFGRDGATTTVAGKAPVLPGGRRWDALLALAPPLFLALWPGRTMIVSAVTNDGLAEGMCLVVLYLSLRTLSQPPGRRDLVWLGLAFSAALMAKSTSLALAPIVLLALALSEQRRAGAEGRNDPSVQTEVAKRLLRHLALLAGIVVLLTGWWFVRNQLLYGDPLAAGVFEKLFSQDRATPEYFFKLGMSGGAYFALVVINTALSFWGIYGQANVYSPLWYYLLGLAIWLGALAGLVWQKLRPCQQGPAATPPQSSGRSKAARQTRDKRLVGEGQERADGEQDWRQQGFALCWVLLIVVIAFFLRFNTSFYQAQARYLFAASGAIWLLVTLGLWDLGRSRYGLGAVAVALAIMFFMSLWSVAGFSHLIAAHYPPPLFGG